MSWFANLPRPLRGFAPVRPLFGVLIVGALAFQPSAAFARSAEDWSANELKALDANALGLAREARAKPVAGGPYKPVRYNQILGTGQSLMEAAQGWPALTVDPVPGALMLGDSERPRAIGGKRWLTIGPDELEPLTGAVDFKGAPFTAEDVAQFPRGGAAAKGDREALQKIVARGESPLIAAAASLAGAWLPADRRAADWSSGDNPMAIVSNAAIGGTTIARLMPGAKPDLYAKIPALFAEVADIARRDGESYRIAAQVHMQGEADYKDIRTGAAARFRDDTLAYREAVARDAKAATGQAEKPKMFTHQTGAAFTRDEGKLGVGMAQWTLSRDEPDWFLVGPVYQYPDKGGHLTVNGNRWFGSKLGEAMRTVLVEGRAWRPLAPLWPDGAAGPEIRMRGRTILLPLDVPAPPVRFAPAYVKGEAVTFPDKGFAAFVDGAPAPIVSVETAGDALIAIRLAAEPPAGARVELAYATATASKGAGNVVDSDPARAADSYLYRPDAGMAPDEDIRELEGKPYPLSNALIAFWAEAKRD